MSDTYIVSAYVTGRPKPTRWRHSQSLEADQQIHDILARGFSEVREDGTARIYWPAHRIARVEVELEEAELEGGQ